MEYQLVVQIAGDTPSILDAVVVFEDEIRSILGDSAVVDGHDIGSGEANIFILTPDPSKTFHQVTPALERAQQTRAVTVAFRAIDGDEYHVPWPKNSSVPFSVA